MFSRAKIFLITVKFKKLGFSAPFESRQTNCPIFRVVQGTSRRPFALCSAFFVSPTVNFSDFAGKNERRILLAVPVDIICRI